MNRLMILVLSLCLLPVALLAEEGEKKKKEPAKRKAREWRTELAFTVRKLSPHNVKQVKEKVTALSGVEEVKADMKKQELKLLLASGGRLDTDDLNQALRGTKCYLDLRRFMLPKFPTTVTLKGPMKGAQRKHNRHTRYLPGLKLIQELRQISGVRSVQWISDRAFKLGLDRHVSYLAVANVVARLGSRQRGSGSIAKVSWLGEKMPASERKRQAREKQKEAREKRNKEAEERRRKRKEQQEKQKGEG